MAAYALSRFVLALHLCTPDTAGMVQAQGEVCSGLSWELGVGTIHVHPPAAQTGQTDSLLVV